MLLLLVTAGGTEELGLMVKGTPQIRHAASEAAKEIDFMSGCEVSSFSSLNSATGRSVVPH